MSQNNTMTHGKNYRGVNLNLTAEIMQTYDLFKFAIAQSNGSALLKFPPYNTT